MEFFDLSPNYDTPELNAIRNKPGYCEGDGYHVGKKFKRGDKVRIKGTVKPVGTIWIDDGQGAYVNWPRKKTRLWDLLEDLELAE